MQVWLFVFGALACMGLTGALPVKEEKAVGMESADHHINKRQLEILNTFSGDGKKHCITWLDLYTTQLGFSTFHHSVSFSDPCSLRHRSSTARESAGRPISSIHGRCLWVRVYPVCNSQDAWSDTYLQATNNHLLQLWRTYSGHWRVWCYIFRRIDLTQHPYHAFGHLYQGYWKIQEEMGVR